MKIEEGVRAREADDRRDRRAGARASRGRGRSTELEEALAWAAERDAAGPAGRARLEPARRRRGRRGARRPARRRARRRRGPAATLLVAGGGAANAVCLHRARAAGLGGLRVRVRDPRHRGRRRPDERRRVRQRLEGDPRAGARRRRRRRRAGSRTTSSTSATGTRRSRPGQVVAQVEFRLAPRPADEIKATVAEMQAQRKATQPTNKRTFGSVFKNPEHELGAGQMLEACGLKGHRDRRCADLAAPRELHRERRRRDGAPTRSR